MKAPNPRDVAVVMGQVGRIIRLLNIPVSSAAFGDDELMEESMAKEKEEKPKETRMELWTCGRCGSARMFRDRKPDNVPTSCADCSGKIARIGFITCVEES